MVTSAQKSGEKLSARLCCYACVATFLLRSFFILFFLWWQSALSRLPPSELFRGWPPPVGDGWRPTAYYLLSR